jgi:hypothetical protein
MADGFGVGKRVEGCGVTTVAFPQVRAYLLAS